MSIASGSTTISSPSKVNGTIVNGNASKISAAPNNNSNNNNKRRELETLIREFQSKLGPDWDKYHENLSYFLVGKLSRQELVNIIMPILKNGLIKYHNKLLLLNFANSFSDIPIDFQNDFSSFWNKKAKTKTVKSSQFERFKQNILGLPIKERRRIRNISRDSGKKNKISAGITLTRHALLPKIPSIQDKEQQQLHVNNIVAWQQDVVNGINTPICTDTYELPDNDDLMKRVVMIMRESGLTGGLNPQVMDMILLGLETYLKNIVESSIDVARFRENKYNSSDFLTNAIQTVKNTMTVTGNSDNLESKLHNDATSPTNNSIMDKKNGETRSERANTRSKSTTKNDNDDNEKNLETKEQLVTEEENDHKRRKLTLNIEDMYNTFTMFPYLIENNDPKYSLGSVKLKNDDDVDEMDYILPKFQMSYLAASANNRLKKDQEEKDDNPQNKDPDTRAHIGTTDELKWVIHDLFTKM